MKQQQPGGIADPATIEVHPMANLFPMIEGAEFDELVEDLRQNGLRTPLVLHPDGRLLDGRNRLRACLAAGVEPRFECWDGKGSALELVISLNLRRRHLNESQRALLAARLKDKLPEDSGKALDTKGIASANLRSGKSAKRAATLLNVSSRSVEHASQLLKIGDRRLLVLVESGQLAVSAAAGKAAGRQPKARRTVRRPSPGEVVLAMWAPPGRVDEATKLVEQWGFERTPGPDRAAPESERTLLVASRRNPLSS
jgi:ParB-like chromosome segregation protein Spo0J